MKFSRAGVVGLGCMLSVGSFFLLAHALSNPSSADAQTPAISVAASTQSAISAPDTVETNAAPSVSKTPIPDAVPVETPVAKAPETGASVAATALGKPVSLLIPAISLTTPLVPVGLTSDNAVDVPNTLHLAGWFTGTALPGAQGSALIDGHVGDSIGDPGVFANLHTVEPGDDIYVKTSAGQTLRFVVKETDVYALADVPMARILANTDERRLAIITCSGNWVPSEATFDHRLVVYAELAD